MEGEPNTEGSELWWLLQKHGETHEATIFMNKYGAAYIGKITNKGEIDVDEP